MAIVSSGTLARRLLRRRLMILAMFAVPLGALWVDCLTGMDGLSLIPRGCVSLGLVGLAIAASVYDDRLFVRPLRHAQDALARSLERYRHLVDESCDLVLVIRSHEKRILISPGVERLLGYSLGETPRLSPRALINEQDLPAIIELYNALSPAYPRTSATFRMNHKSGSTVWAEARFHRLTRKASFETVIAIKNVTLRHQEAEALRLASHAARLAQADADDANQAKTEFLARMSHEIRTPLNAVIGFGALLQELPNLPTQARHYSERIKGAGHALLTIVDDILNFAQVESGVVDLKPKAFALPLLIDECFSIVQQAALSKHLSLDVKLLHRLPPGVLGDEARLRQILLNLLNNAIKFTHEGSVRLEIHYERTLGPNSLKFSIIDTGIGIADEDAPRLFQRFRQVDGTIRRTYGGTGLGLAISKQLVELMGGTIGVQSTKGEGSTFWFVLDLPAAPLLLQADQTKRYRPKQSLNLLVVEDVAINQELVCLILEAGGHTVDVVGDGADAIMAVQNGLYDAVLMDVQMPHVDGMTATRIIRTLPDPRGRVPIIAMTANVLPEQVQLAAAAGMDGVIHKPFTAAEIYEVLEKTQMAVAQPKSDIAMGALDTAVLSKLVGLLGEAKVKALLATLTRSLTDRFTAVSETSEGMMTLRGDAHASIAGAGMLGFTRFSGRCRTLELASDDEAFGIALVEVRVAAAEVMHMARTLAAPAASLRNLGSRLRFETEVRSRIVPPHFLPAVVSRRRSESAAPLAFR